MKTKSLALIHWTEKNSKLSLFEEACKLDSANHVSDTKFHSERNHPVYYSVKGLNCLPSTFASSRNLLFCFLKYILEIAAIVKARPANTI